MNMKAVTVKVVLTAGTLTVERILTEFAKKKKQAFTIKDAIRSCTITALKDFACRYPTINPTVNAIVLSKSKY